MLHSTLQNRSDFFASDGWLKRMEKSLDVHFLSVYGGKLLSDPAAVDEFTNKLKDLIEKEGLHPEQIYNVNETDLNFKRLPVNTYDTDNERSVPSFKVNN